MQKRSSAQLLSLFLNGDEQAYLELKRRYGADIRRVITGLVRRLGKPMSDVEDIEQFMQLQILEYGHDFDPEQSKFVNWYFACAKRSVARYYRPERAQKRGGKVATVPMEYEPVSRDGTPDAAIIEREEVSIQPQRVREALASLPAQQRTVVKAHFLNGETLQHIASRTRTPVGTVKSRLHRGLALLRNQLMPAG